MATEETEDVIDDDEEEDSYSESEEPWDGPYRDPDDSYDPNWDTDADSDELELREVVTRALMEELEDEDDGLDSDDREFIDSMNPVPGNSIQSDCSCRFRAKCECKSDCIPSYIPLWNKSWEDCSLISKSFPYKPPFMWSEGETRGKGYNFGNILKCAEGLSQYVEIFNKRKREEIKCPAHTQEILCYSNYLVLKLVNGSSDSESEKEIGDPFPAFDEFQQQVKKIVSVAKFALIQELGELFPARLPSLALSHILDFLAKDFSFVKELENETHLKLQDTIYLMFESLNLLISPDTTMIGGGAYISPLRMDNVKEKIKGFPKLKADLLLLLNQICRTTVIVESNSI